MIDLKKIAAITARAEASLDARPGIEVQNSWSNRTDCAEDVLYLIQCVELISAQLELLVAPEAMIAFLKRYHDLTPERKKLVVNIINELTPEGLTT